MKKEGLLFTFLLISVLPFVFATTINNTDTDTSKINNAYTCLTEKVKDNCDDLSSEERFFTLLATGKCKDEVLDDSKNDECWPKSNCNIKNTAQAILALRGTNTGDSEEWLVDQTVAPENLDWYLEIESTNTTTCTIEYDGDSHQIIIDEEKKISNSAGSCLSLAQDGYWLKVSPSCYGEEFEISCDRGFLTTLLFKSSDSSTIHVSKEINSASAEGTITEVVNSSCFTNDDSCDYEGTLWATLVLDYLGEDISPYLPYLITMTEDNGDLLPESFLYLLTGYVDFRNELLIKQKTNYWDESGDKFYDTAVALYSLKDGDYIEKINSKKWLLEVQDSDGCWQGNIRNTAFILNSIFPRTFDSGDVGLDCEESGNYCLSSINCEGTILDQYDCAGILSCCDAPLNTQTCADQLGEICNSNQICSGGTTISASDISEEEICCIEGDCKEIGTQQEADCESNSGVCEISSCGEGYEESFSYTCDFNEICCIQKETPNKSSSWIIWTLLILIILVVIGIIFKDKLRIYWLRISSKFNGGESSFESRPPRFPPMPPVRPSSPRPPIQRKILPPEFQPRPSSPRPPIQRKTSQEMDEVLKKLKEMGK